MDGGTGTVLVDAARVDIDAVARHGPAQVEVRGVTDVSPAGVPRTHIDVVGRDVPLDESLRAGFRERAPDVWDPWQPQGTLGTVRVQVTQGGDLPLHATVSDVRIDLDGRARFRPGLLPTSLGSVHGAVEVLDGAGVSRVFVEDVVAAGDGFRVAVDGVVEGEGASARERLDVRVDAPAVGRELVPALLRSDRLTPAVKRALTLLRPRGSLRADVTLHATGSARDDAVTVHLDGASIAGWEDVPLAADGLRGTVSIGADTLRTERLQGTVLGGVPFSLGGRLEGLAGDAPGGEVRPYLVVDATDLPLGERLRTGLGALGRDAAAFWDALAPTDDARADVNVVVRPPGAPGGPLDVTAKRLRGGYTILGFDLRLADGEAVWGESGARATARGRVGNGDFDARDVTWDAASGDVSLTLATRGLDFPRDLSPLFPPEAVRSLEASLPGRVLHAPRLDVRHDRGARRTELSGELALRPRNRDDASPGLAPELSVTIDTGSVWQPDGAPVSFAFTGALGDATLQVGTEVRIDACAIEATGSFPAEGTAVDARIRDARLHVLDLPVEDTRFDLFVRGGHVRLEELAGRLFGGRLTGRVGAGGERHAYAGRFEIEDARLEAIVGGGENRARTGDVAGFVRFRNPGGEPEELEGSGRVDVSDARIARVPGLTPVMNAVNRAMFGLAQVEGDFHEGHVEFDLRGSRVLVRDIHLAGPNLLGLGPTELRDGDGEIALEDGRIDVVVYPRVRVDPLGLDPIGIVDRLTRGFQAFLGRLRVTGTLRNPRVVQEVVPGGREDLHPQPQPAGDLLPYGDERW